MLLVIFVIFCWISIAYGLSVSQVCILGYLESLLDVVVIERLKSAIVHFDCYFQKVLMHLKTVVNSQLILPI